MALQIGTVNKTDFILRTEVHSMLLESFSEDAEVQLSYVHFSTCGSHDPFLPEGILFPNAFTEDLIS